ncbi:MAG: FAD-dependent oxidoreductase, partial [Pseudomonadota bacterium]
MNSHYRVVIIGGGVVGTSVAYHLAKYGWSDVCLLERSVLTAGSSWHAAGGVHALNADPNMAALQGYTIDLLSEIQEESGQDIGLHMTGGLVLAGTQDRWEWLQSAYRVFQSIGIEDCELISPEEAQRRCPIMSTEGITGAMWADREGYVDTTGTVHAYATAAKMRGASIFEHTKVEELIQTSEGWKIVTDKGTITCEHVVNAAGLWAKQVGRMAGIELPVSPLKHHYLISDTIPALEELDFEMPMAVDLEGFTYLRQDQKGVLLGIYEINHEHWAMDGAPWDYGMELFQEQTDRIENELICGFNRYPVLQDVGVKTWVNGAFTFAPDGNPLVGPVPGKPGYWCACAVMAGFLQGGGVGKSLAEWMIHGEAEADVWSMDVTRFGTWAENRRYIRETTGQFYSRRFVMTYPNEQLPAGRPLKMAPAHDAMDAAGAVWGTSWDMEVPLYFAPKDFAETPTLKRSNAHDIVAEECRAVRDAVGLLDISAFSRYEVTGPDAESWLDGLLACKLPKPGRAKLAPMLAEDGRLKGDLTVFNWGDGTWWIMGSYYLRRWHMRWFNDHLQGNVFVRDLGEEICGFSLAGPNSRKVIETLTEDPVGALPFMGCGRFDIGLIRASVARMSVAGELGFEINCRYGDHVALRRMLLEAGAEHGIREYGFNALLSLRLEKSFGI